MTASFFHERASRRLYIHVLWNLVETPDDFEIFLSPSLHRTFSQQFVGVRLRLARIHEIIVNTATIWQYALLKAQIKLKWIQMKIYWCWLFQLVQPFALSCPGLLPSLESPLPTALCGQPTKRIVLFSIGYFISPSWWGVAWWYREHRCCLTFLLAQLMWSFYACV